MMGWCKPDEKVTRGIAAGLNSCTFFLFRFLDFCHFWNNFQTNFGFFGMLIPLLDFRMNKEQNFLFWLTEWRLTKTAAIPLETFSCFFYWNPVLSTTYNTLWKIKKLDNKEQNFLFWLGHPLNDVINYYTAYLFVDRSHKFPPAAYLLLGQKHLPSNIPHLMLNDHRVAWKHLQ